MLEPVLHSANGVVACPFCGGEHSIRPAQPPLAGGIEIADPCEPLQKAMLAGEKLAFSIGGGDA